jgi:hypothetical protein
MAMLTKQSLKQNSLSMIFSRTYPGFFPKTCITVKQNMLLHNDAAHGWPHTVVYILQLKGLFKENLPPTEVYI